MEEGKAEPGGEGRESPGGNKSSGGKKNVRFKRSKIFVTPSNDSAEDDSDPPAVTSISRLASYSNTRRSPRGAQKNTASTTVFSRSLFAPNSPSGAISSASCSPSSISESHALTESSPLMETPEAIRNWNYQKNRRTADTTYLTSTSSPAVNGAYVQNGGRQDYPYYYSDLRSEMNAMTPGKQSWKSMLIRSADDGSDYYTYRSRFDRLMGDKRRLRLYGLIAFLGALMFTLIWLVMIEPCSTSDTIHSAIKFVFGKGSHSNNQQIQSLDELIQMMIMEKSGKIFRNSAGDKDDDIDNDDENKGKDGNSKDNGSSTKSGSKGDDDDDDDDDDDGGYTEEGDISSSAVSTLSDTFRLVLLGDSLMSESYKKLNLGGVIEGYLSTETVSVINCAKSGSEIHVIRQRPLLNCTLPHSPDATILFFDSDISYVDETELSAAEVIDIRDQYRADTAYVIETLLDAGSQVALCSPGVLGEGARLFGPIHSPRLYKKQKMLDDYAAMNEELAGQYGIPYIDVRKAFLDAIPFHQLYYRGCVTYDGEHLNARGMKIVAKLFVSTVMQWLAHFSEQNDVAEISTSDSGSDSQDNSIDAEVADAEKIQGSGRRGELIRKKR